MINENLETLVQHARDKKPTDFKTVLTDEIDSRINAKVTEIRDGLSKNMFKMHENLDEAGSRPITSDDLKAMAVETHTKSGFTAIASRNFPKSLPGIWLNDYVWEDKKIAVKAAQAWIDGFGDGDDYFKNAEQGTKALAKFAKSNKKSWHARVKGESLHQDSVAYLDENCEGHPDGVEHTHEDGTVHTHEGGDAPHTHEDEESIHEENPYVRKLSKPAQKVFHQVMHIINKEPSDYQSGKQSGALVDDEGNRLNPKDLAAVKMAVQNESANESIHEAKISVATDASDWKPVKEAKKFNLKASVAKGKAKPSMPGGGDPDRLDLIGEEKDIVAFFKAHFGAEGNESLKDLQKEFGEEIEEGKLPPALQKAIDAKKKNNSKSDDVDKSPEDDEDEDKKKDENIANFGDKKAKSFTDDDNPTDNKKKKDKKEETEIDEAGSRPITSSDLKAMAVETHTKSGFTAIASRNFPKPLPGIWLNDYVWEDKKIAVKAAQAWIDGFGDGDDYFKNAEQGTKALAKFAKSNKKSWHARVKGENLQQDTVDFLEK